MHSLDLAQAMLACPQRGLCPVAQRELAQDAGNVVLDRTLGDDELNCEVLLKATKVDGVYNADPMRVPTARRFREVSYMHAITMSLGVMDATALSLCGENHLPIVVFDMHARGEICGIVRGEPGGTLVHDMSAGQDFVWDTSN